MDRLSTLLAQFGMHATTFYAGLFSGELAYDSQDRSGKLYLLNTGKARLHIARQEIVISQPRLLFIPRPYKHSLTAIPTDNTKLVSVTLSLASE